MDIPVRKGNIFTLLEDDEVEEVQAPKSKQPKTQPAPPAQAKSDPKPSKPKPAKKQTDPEPAPPVPQTQPKEQRNPKKQEKPEKDDRKSKTGRGREMKKGGGGKHNWGKPEDDVKAEPEAAWTGEENKDAQNAEPEKEGAQTEEPVEKKPDFITFSDYLNPKESAEESKQSDEEVEEKGKDLLNFKVSFGSRSERRGRGRGRRGGETREDRPQRESKRPDRGNVNRDQQVPNPLDFKSFPSLA